MDRETNGQRKLRWQKAVLLPVGIVLLLLLIRRVLFLGDPYRHSDTDTLAVLLSTATIDRMLFNERAALGFESRNTTYCGVALGLGGHGTSVPQVDDICGLTVLVVVPSSCLQRMVLGQS